MLYKSIADVKEMAAGKRNLALRPLTEEEIQIVIKAGKKIGIDDQDIYIFNDEEHIRNPYLGTGYNYIQDKIYITMNVFPDDKYASIHPRDLMSVEAVLAHEYYGHRPHRDEYIRDKAISQEKKVEYRSIPYWQDECRASIEAAKIAPGLTLKDKCDLIQDAVYRAHEFGQTFELDDYMKGVLYGFTDEKPIVPVLRPIRYISEESIGREYKEWEDNHSMPQMLENIDDEYIR